MGWRLERLEQQPGRHILGDGRLIRSVPVVEKRWPTESKACSFVLLGDIIEGQSVFAVGRMLDGGWTISIQAFFFGNLKFDVRANTTVA